MRAAIISLGSKSSLMTAEAMEKYFTTVDMINLKEVEVSLGKDAGVLYQGRPFPQYDCVYVKGSFRYANLLRSITSMLDKKVAYLPLPSDSFTIVHNKLLTHLELERHNIPMPRTYIGPSIESAKKLLKTMNYPIIMKFPEGTQGKGVLFGDSYSSASSMLDALGALNQPFIIQEYVESGGSDLRVIVIGDKAIAAMRRTASSEEKRANLHAGGKAEPVLINREVANLAIRTAKALNSDVCGVDILEGPFGPVVIEANISPGLQGITAATTVDVPMEIAKHFAQMTQQILLEKNKIQGRSLMNELNINSIRAPVTSGEKLLSSGKEFITNLTFKGERVVLPSLVTRITGFSDLKNYKIVAKKGQLHVEEFII